MSEIPFRFSDRMENPSDEDWICLNAIRRVVQAVNACAPGLSVVCYQKHSTHPKVEVMILLDDQSLISIVFDTGTFFLRGKFRDHEALPCDEIWVRTMWEKYLRPAVKQKLRADIANITERLSAIDKLEIS